MSSNCAQKASLGCSLTLWGPALENHLSGQLDSSRVQGSQCNSARQQALLFTPDSLLNKSWG